MEIIGLNDIVDGKKYAVCVNEEAGVKVIEVPKGADYKFFQNCVGGLLEDAVVDGLPKRVSMWCNEEGAVLPDMTVNATASKVCKRQPIYGPIVFATRSLSGMSAATVTEVVHMLLALEF